MRWDSKFSSCCYGNNNNGARRKQKARLPLCDPNSASSIARISADTHFSSYTHNRNRRLSSTRPGPIALLLLVVLRQKGPKHPYRKTLRPKTRPSCTTYGYHLRSQIVRLSSSLQCRQTTHIARALLSGTPRHLQVLFGTLQMPPQVHPHIRTRRINIRRAGRVPFHLMLLMDILLSEEGTGEDKVRQR